jgi:hypothetical protein
VSGQHHPPPPVALRPGDRTRYPLNVRLGGSQPVWTICKGESCRPYRGSSSDPSVQLLYRPSYRRAYYKIIALFVGRHRLYLLMSIFKQTNSVAFSPQANYTDWATATCRRNLVPTFADRGVSRGQRGGSLTVVNLFSRQYVNI